MHSMLKDPFAEVNIRGTKKQVKVQIQYNLTSKAKKSLNIF